jgi:uncharacterized membrane protein YraQ (UPF0718 family)
MYSLMLLLVTAIALAISYWRDPMRTRKALQTSVKSFLALMPGLLTMTGLIGVLLAMTPEHVLVKLFQQHGLTGFFLVTLVGSVAAIPGPIAFPLAGSLLKLGASVTAMAAFITTLTMVGVVTAPMEAEFFGRRFTLLRQGLSLVLALIVGGLMGVIL